MNITQRYFAEQGRQVEIIKLYGSMELAPLVGLADRIVDVVDTVGAGDSFLGSLLYQLCSDNNPQYAIDFACAVGAMVAQSAGATPVLTLEQITGFMQPV